MHRRIGAVGGQFQSQDNQVNRSGWSRFVEEVVILEAFSESKQSVLSE